ncbi:MAG TPA: class I SAM-dependent methyltransferase [Myxococcaceae bacterium]|nr:class I SAM-dependent methyltransferase [Myxococcaceae bacterium]
MPKPPRPALTVVGPDPETRFYLRRALERTGEILVLGAADGRLPIELAGMGRTVVAVEPSALLRELLEARVRESGARVEGRIRLLADDPRSLTLDAPFGLVFAPHNALGLARTREELEAMLGTASRHLGPDGLLAFDVRHLVEHAPDPDTGPHGPVPPARQPYAPHLRERRPAGARRARSLQRLRSRPLRVGELDRALGAAGLEATERYADFLQTPFSSESLLQVVVAHRL